LSIPDELQLPLIFDSADIKVQNQISTLKIIFFLKAGVGLKLGNSVTNMISFIFENLNLIAQRGDFRPGLRAVLNRAKKG